MVAGEEHKIRKCLKMLHAFAAVVEVDMNGKMVVALACSEVLFRNIGQLFDFLCIIMVHVAKHGFCSLLCF